MGLSLREPGRVQNTKMILPEITNSAYVGTESQQQSWQKIAEMRTKFNLHLCGGIAYIHIHAYIHKYVCVYVL